MRTDPNVISLFEAALRPSVSGGMRLDAVYSAAERSGTVITYGDRPWSLISDDDLITIWHALKASSDPRAEELRKRLETEMQLDHGVMGDAERQRKHRRRATDARPVALADIGGGASAAN